MIFLDRHDKIVAFFRKYVIKSKKEIKPSHEDQYWRSPGFWSRVLSKNLLAFSDTQLLTGLAIQFTAMLKHCDITVYHFRIVTELAFLTTVTHLLTVIALRNYFVKNRWINLPRIFFMLGNLGLLGYTSFVAYSYDLAGVDLSMKLACFFQNNRPPVTSAFGGKWAALIIGAIGGHVTVILAMYWLDDPKEGQQRKWWWWAGAAFRTWIVAPVYSIYGIWMAGDGLRFTQALGKPPEHFKIIGDEEEWNFGQFLPILLLALPVFAGWESFWEEKDYDQDRFGRHGFRGSRGPTTSQLNMAQFHVPKATVGRRRQSSQDVSVEERDTESNGPSPMHTPSLRSSSPVSPVGDSTQLTPLSPVHNSSASIRSRPSLSPPPASTPPH